MITFCRRKMEKGEEVGVAGAVGGGRRGRSMTTMMDGMKMCTTNPRGEGGRLRESS